MGSLVTLEVKKAVAIVTFNNPPRGYMNSAQVEELAVIVDQIAADNLEFA